MRLKLLIAIIFLAAVLRFSGLGSNPPSLNWDEIAIGWNAYSILQTGKDEFGQYLPSTFRSFDDYKSPAYIYATTISIALFGKTEFAVRFMSALAGTATVPLMYYFVKTLLVQKKDDTPKDQYWINRIDNMALFSAGMLAITPWHIHFSRVAFESNFALFWEVLGAWLFLLSLHKFKQSTVLLFASVIAFGIALYSYANARLFIVLLLMGWGIYFFRKLLSMKKGLIFAIIFGLIIAVPLINQMTQGVGLARFQATSIVNRPEVFARNKEQAVEDYHDGQGTLSVVVHNVRLPLVRQVIQNYLDHYQYSFLVVKSDLPRHQVPGFGLLYPWQLPLIIIGTVFLISRRKHINAFLPLWWLLIAPIPAAITWQVPHSIRSQLMLPILSILSAIGLWALLKYFQQLDLISYTRSQKNRLMYTAHWVGPKVAFLGILGIIGLSTLHFSLNYQLYLPKEFAKQWLYGRKEMVEIVEAEKDKYDTIIVDLSVDWAYLWFLWYGNYTPEWYLAQGGTVSGGFEETQNKIGKIQFKPFNFDPTYFGSQNMPPNSLFIALPERFPGKLIPYKMVRDPAGKPAIYIVKS